MTKKIVIVGSGNAAMSAGIAALEAGADVLMLETVSYTHLTLPTICSV